MSHDFKIFGMCVVQNEVDIIEHCLREASKRGHLDAGR